MWQFGGRSALGVLVVMAELSGRPAGAVSVRRALVAEAASVRKARRLVALVGAVPVAARRDAELVVSELVTNALQHAGFDRDELIEVCVTRLQTRLRIDVTDRKVFLNASAETRDHRAGGGGFGLRIVTRVAVHWPASDGVTTAWIAI
jgi:anti-sigma regulatory factor (Ser/Thr protein kinase)